MLWSLRSVVGHLVVRPRAFVVGCLPLHLLLPSHQAHGRSGSMKTYRLRTWRPGMMV
jgi:hypothetical protein